jgi:hypothetical protein
MCGKKMNPGDYWFIHYWGNNKGEEMMSYICSTKCLMEHIEKGIKMGVKKFYTDEDFVGLT